MDKEKVKIYHDKFGDNLENDLNTSSCITLLYDVLKDDSINDKTKREIIDDFEQVLSLNLFVEKNTDIDVSFKKYIEEMIEKRKVYKKEKNFEEADKIRKELMDKGIMIKDTREGTTYEIVK